MQAHTDLVKTDVSAKLLKCLTLHVSEIGKHKIFNLGRKNHRALNHFI